MTVKIADLAGADPYPGEAPETEFRNAVRPDYTTADERDPELFNWVATPLFAVVNDGDHAAMLDQLAWTPEQPHSAGTLELRYRWDAQWSLLSGNMSLGQVEKVLKKYSKDQGWNWQGLSLPSGDQFGKSGSVPGIGEINPGVKDWKNKEWSGMETFDSYDPHSREGYPGFTDPTDDSRPPEQVYTCSECGYPASDHDDFRGHIMREHVHQGLPPTDPQPVVDLDDALPAGWNEVHMDQTTMRQASLAHVLAHRSLAQIPQIPGPIPFIYDIEQDRIYVGHPGERHSDIQGRFTPGGILEGQYDPKGNVQIRTDTDHPYTVKHMAELWYHMHPELEIKGIHLLVGQEKYKLAKLSSADIGNKVKNLLAADPAAHAATLALSPFGKVYAVGGCVRDVILGKVPNDIDLLVQGIPPEDVEATLERLPGRVDVTGKTFGVFRYRTEDGDEVEIALPRRERSVGVGHRDFQVETDHMMPIEEDLGRRDFTANAMAVDLHTGELIDPYNGSTDVKARQLNTVSDESFEEDPLRILRTLALVSRHQLIPTREVLQEIKDHAYLLEYIPGERIQQELDKMMKGDDPALAMSLLETTGVFKEILPEYEKTLGFDQKNSYHDEPLHDHLKTVLRETARRTADPDVRWAALLHDIGKPRSQWIDPETEQGHYYKDERGHGENHWEVGADMAGEALRRLHFPTDRTERVQHLINHHMFPRFENERGARKFINRVGDEHVDDLLTLRAADISGRTNRKDDVPMMQSYVQSVREQGQPTSVAGLAINGDDLIAAGFQPGPQMGELLRNLTQRVIDEPELNTRDSLLSLAAESWNPERTANILDPIQETLDPTVFDRADTPEPRLKPKHVKFIKQLVYSTLREAGWPDPSEYLTLVLTGSLTTYQWSDKSDVDTSLWIDVTRFPEWVRADLISLMIEHCDGTILPGTPHPMQCFVVDSVRYTRDDLYRVGLRSAYDLDKQAWLVPPDRTTAVDVAKLYKAAVLYAHGVVDKLKMMLKYDKYAVKPYWKFLHRRRFLDMRDGKGDFAESNIVYKMIANEDLFPAISEATGEHIASHE